jgi:hypothetical protein
MRLSRPSRYIKAIPSETLYYISIMTKKDLKDKRQQLPPPQKEEIKPKKRLPKNRDDRILNIRTGSIMIQYKVFKDLYDKWKEHQEPGDDPEIARIYANYARFLVQSASELGRNIDSAVKHLILRVEQQDEVNELLMIKEEVQQLAKLEYEATKEPIILLEENDNGNTQN